MSKSKWTKKSAFAHFGAKGKNGVWSWSAHNADRTTIVLTLWHDLVKWQDSPITYDIFGRTNLLEWKDRNGNLERIEDLKWARDHCDGLFRVVITVAENTEAEPRKIARCYPHDRLIMRIVSGDLNEQTGEFRAVNVGK